MTSITMPVAERVSSFLHPQAIASEYLHRSLKQASMSLALGVFLGAALTTGTAFGLAAAYFANDKVLKKLRKAAVTVVTTARDAALNTREGQALANAVLQHAPPSAPQETVINPSDPVVGLREGELLPEVAPPGGHYKPLGVCSTTIYLSGYTSRRADGTPIAGVLVPQNAAKLAGCMVAAEGAEAARTCALGHLAILQRCCGGLGNVRRVLKVTCFVNSDPTMTQKAGGRDAAAFADSPAVANGYSDLLVAALGPERGSHARSAVCVSGLPGGAAVEVEAVVELVDPTHVRPP